MYLVGQLGTVIFQNSLHAYTKLPEMPIDIRIGEFTNIHYAYTKPTQNLHDFEDLHTF